MSLKSLGKKFVTQYWLGAPCQYHPERKDLEGFPKEDLGGREISLPDGLTPQQFYNMTMPELQAVHQEAQRRFAGGQGNGKLHPFGVLAQGVQLVWVFASVQTTRMYEMIVQDRAHVARLEARITQLEALLQKESVDPPDA